MATDPIKRAGQLAMALTENTTALRKVRRGQHVISVLVGLLFALSAVTGWLYLEVRDTQQRSCESGNNVRSGLLHVADTLEAQQLEPRPDGRPRTPAEVEAARKFIADLREDFALRRCST